MGNYIKQLKHINADIKESRRMYESVGMGLQELEALLKQPEYAAIDQDYSYKNKKNRRETNAVEATVSFGSILSDLFEDLVIEKGRVPSQQEFLDRQLPIMKEFWLNDKNAKYSKGLGWTPAVEQACINRTLRTYSSQLVEYHAITALRELFPDWNIYSSSYLDLVLGVDLVVETDKKFMYLHVFKNSEFGFKEFYRKEKRGGLKHNKKFHRFDRDFSGDKCLTYDYHRNLSSETTQFINGHPLFKPEFLKKQMQIFNKFNQIGTLKDDETRLKELNDFIERVTGGK